MQVTLSGWFVKQTRGTVLQPSHLRMLGRDKGVREASNEYMPPEASQLSR